MQAPRGVQLTGTNRSCGLIAFPFKGERISTRELWKSSKCFLCVVFRESPNPSRMRSFTKHGVGSLRQIRGGRVQQFGGHKAVVRPDPIPNSAVKRSLADGSGCIASARVGSRQSFNKTRRDVLRVLCFFWKGRVCQAANQPGGKRKVASSG